MTTTATVELDQGMPRVRIDTTAAAVWRVAEDGTRTPVRQLVTGGVTYDYECPQAQPVYYSTAGFDSGDSGVEDSGLVEIPDVGVWLAPANNPAAGVRLLVGGFEGWSQSGPVSIAEIPGSARPVAVSWRRGGRSGALTATALEPDDYLALVGVLQSAGPFLLSYSEARWVSLAGEHWVVIGDTSESIVGLPVAPSAWQVSLPLTAVERPNVVTALSVTIDDLTGSIDSLTGTIDTIGV